MATMRRQVGAVAERTGAADPATLADRVMLILDGLYTNGLVLGAAGSAPAAVAFTEDVVHAATDAADARR